MIECDPDNSNIEPCPELLKEASEFINTFLQGVSSTPSIQKHCLFTVSQSCHGVEWERNSRKCVAICPIWFKYWGVAIHSVNHLIEKHATKCIVVGKYI